jgi:hypothetical protein
MYFYKVQRFYDDVSVEGQDLDRYGNINICIYINVNMYIHI